MKNFIKTSTLLALTFVLFQSCESEETHEDIISDEQSITTNLSEKIIATTTTLNDYNFFVTNAAKTECELLTNTNGFFNNPEGDYFSFTLSGIESLDMWLTQYNAAKLEAFNATGVEFSDEDFFISFIGNSSGIFGLHLRESMLNYFENCNEFDDFSSINFGLPFTDISSNCDSNDQITFYVLDNNVLGSSDNFETIGLNSVEDSLASFNLENSTNYELEDLNVGFVKYITPNNEELFLTAIKDLTNYFKDCKFSRDPSDNDCLNFVYPIEINRFNLELEEVITTTLENDEDLIETFSIDVGELGFVFPISLIGLNGSVLEIDTNAALENALDNSVEYCN